VLVLSCFYLAVTTKHLKAGKFQHCCVESEKMPLKKFFSFFGVMPQNKKLFASLSKIYSKIAEVQLKFSLSGFPNSNYYDSG